MRKLLVLLVWLVVVTPAMAAVLFSDTFDRANTTGTMEDGSGNQWKNVTANAEISGNHVQCKVDQNCSAVGALVSNITTSQANAVISALMLQGTDGLTPELTCRNQGSDATKRNFFSAWFDGTTNGYRIGKNVNSTVTVLTVDATGTRLSSARLQILCTGTTDLTVYENGVAIKGPVSDTTFAAGVPGFYDARLLAGAQLFDNFAVCDAVAECDDFSRTGVAAASAPPGGPSGKSLLGVGN